MQHTNRNEIGNAKELSWKEYVKLAVSTESVPINLFGMLQDLSSDSHRNMRATRLLHAVLGLCTEIVESNIAIVNNDEVNTKEELGDIFWYLAIIDDEVNVSDLTKLVPADYDFQHMEFYLGEIQDVVKRHLFYGESLDEENKKGMIPMYRLQLAYWGIWRALEDICLDHGIVITECLIANIEKLSKRFPDLAFNKDHAVNRNVENELSHITASTQDPVDMMFNEIELETPVATAEAGLLGRTEFMLANTAPKVEAEELFSDENSHEIVTDSSFNHFLRETYTTAEIEKLAMQLAFNTAAYYRGINALGIARAYDSLYSAYSGKGDKLEDYSCYIMWRDLGYPLSKIEIVNKIGELRIL